MRPRLGEAGPPPSTCARATRSAWSLFTRQGKAHPWERSSTRSRSVNGLQVGSIYALIALGYTMVYGIVRLINFAHGDFFMLGAYAAYAAFYLFN